MSDVSTDNLDNKEASLSSNDEEVETSEEDLEQSPDRTEEAQVELLEKSSHGGEIEVAPILNPPDGIVTDAPSRTTESAEQPQPELKLITEENKDSFESMAAAESESAVEKDIQEADSGQSELMEGTSPVQNGDGEDKGLSLEEMVVVESELMVVENIQEMVSGSNELLEEASTIQKEDSDEQGSVDIDDHDSAVPHEYENPWIAATECGLSDAENESVDETNSALAEEQNTECLDVAGSDDQSEDSKSSLAGEVNNDSISDDGLEQPVEGEGLENTKVPDAPSKSVKFDVSDSEDEEASLEELELVPNAESLPTDDVASSDGSQTSNSSQKAKDQMTTYVLTAPDRSGETFSKQYTKFISRPHKPILLVLQQISGFSARNPVLVITGVIFLSFLLLIVGYNTNFELQVSENRLWAPTKSLSYQHGEMRSALPGFKEPSGSVFLVFHAEGENILEKEKISRVFSALDLVRSLPPYEETCQNVGADEYPCRIYGITNFWNNSASVFRDVVSSNEKLRKDVSAPIFPNRIPASVDYLMGYSERDPDNHTVTSAQSAYVTLLHTGIPGNWEIEAEKRLLALRERWRNEKGNTLRVEVQTSGSLGREFTRAIEKDIPLVPLVFVVMSLFTASVFVKRDPVQSRAGLGFAAVVAILLSIASGFGLLFCIGVPFTSITQLLPFLLFGIGLDDAFVVMGAYQRTNETKDPVDRIADTIADIGLSITLTTLTSATAFALGCISSVPAVYWLCLYSAPTIVIVYLYQLTFFVGCIVIDERRIAARRRDCLLCLSAQDPPTTVPTGTTQPTEHIACKVMGWYSKRLLNPFVKVAVVGIFAVLFGLCGWSASQLTQEFDFADVLPSDSHVGDLSTALELYRERGALEVQVTFHSVDFSAPETRIQMRNYIANLTATEYGIQPSRFWLDHFEVFVGFGGYTDLPFNKQVDLFLEDPIFGEMYFDAVARDQHGNVIATRTWMPFKVELNDVNEVIEALHTQQDITKAQPINQDAVVNESPYYRFFVFDSLFAIWEFFAVAEWELMLTTVVGIIAVTLVSLVFIPHWSAPMFVFPLICILYIDLLGVLQWGGIHINAMTYVSLAMSIGLLVDFILHVLFRFYECRGSRQEKTIEMLKTMGASILLGGTSTMLGTLPLLLTASDIFYTIFLTFMGIVTLGMSHGLVLLPVLLSMFGPEDSIALEKTVASTKEVAGTCKQLPSYVDLSTSATEDETDYMVQVDIDTGMIYL